MLDCCAPIAVTSVLDNKTKRGPAPGTTPATSYVKREALARCGNGPRLGHVRSPVATANRN